MVEIIKGLHFISYRVLVQAQYESYYCIFNILLYAPVHSMSVPMYALTYFLTCFTYILSCVLTLATRYCKFLQLLYKCMCTQKLIQLITKHNVKACNTYTHTYRITRLSLWTACWQDCYIVTTLIVMCSDDIGDFLRVFGGTSLVVHCSIPMYVQMYGM